MALPTKPIVSDPFYFCMFGCVDALSRASPKLLVAQVAGREAACADWRALDPALRDGGLHAHAIF